MWIGGHALLGFAGGGCNVFSEWNVCGLTDDASNSSSSLTCPNSPPLVNMLCSAEVLVSTSQDKMTLCFWQLSTDVWMWATGQKTWPLLRKLVCDATTCLRSSDEARRAVQKFAVAGVAAARKGAFDSFTCVPSPVIEPRHPHLCHYSRVTRQPELAAPCKGT